MIDGLALSNREYQDLDAQNRLIAAQHVQDKPKIDALKAEAISLKEAIDPNEIRNKQDFIKQFEDALERARRFAEVIFPAPLP